MNVIPDKDELPTTAKPRLIPIPWSEIHCLPKREPLITRVLDRGAMSVVFGGSNTGKTFLALDMSARVALDWDWRNRKVRTGTVVYIAAEGGLGIEERLTAFRTFHDIRAEGVPLFVIPEPIDLCKGEADATLLLQRLAGLPPEPSVELIVVDTLSRAMAGGNENSPDDILAVIDQGIIDAVAWQPSTGQVATRLGVGAMLGEGQIGREGIGSVNLALPVWRTPLDWLRAGRCGVVVLDWNAAAFVLSGLILKAEDKAHRLELTRRLTPVPPTIAISSRRQAA